MHARPQICLHIYHYYHPCPSLIPFGSQIKFLLNFFCKKFSHILIVGMLEKESETLMLYLLTIFFITCNCFEYSPIVLRNFNLLLAELISVYNEFSFWGIFCFVPKMSSWGNNDSLRI